MTDRRRGAGREVEVRALAFEERFEQLGDRDLDFVLSGMSELIVTSPPLRSLRCDVRPVAAFSSPSSRSVIIPCSIATVLIVSDDARSTVSRSISSVIGMTSYRPIRPRYPVFEHAGHPDGRKNSSISGHQPLREPAASISSACSGV